MGCSCFDDNNELPESIKKNEKEENEPIIYKRDEVKVSEKIDEQKNIFSENINDKAFQENLNNKLKNNLNNETNEASKESKYKLKIIWIKNEKKQKDINEDVKESFNHIFNKYNLDTKNDIDDIIYKNNNNIEELNVISNKKDYMKKI